MANKTGILCKAYVRTGGNYAAPVWTEIKGIGNLNQSIQWNGDSIPLRGSFVEKSDKTTAVLEVTGTLRHNMDDSTYELIRDAVNSQSTVLDVMFLTGASNVTGSIGVRYDAKVFQANQDQSSNVTTVMDDIVFRPWFSENEAKSVKVVAGSPVFTNFGE